MYSGILPQLGVQNQQEETNVGYLPESLCFNPAGAFRENGAVNKAQLQVWIKFVVRQLRTPITVGNHKTSKV